MKRRQDVLYDEIQKLIEPKCRYGDRFRDLMLAYTLVMMSNRKKTIEYADKIMKKYKLSLEEKKNESL